MQQRNADTGKANGRKWMAIGLTDAVAAVLALWMVYGYKDYGVALFVLIPILIGAGPALIYGYKRGVSYRLSWQMGFLALVIFMLGMIVFAMEGLICIAMAAPIASLLTWLGSAIGFTIVTRRPNRSTLTVLMLIVSVPVASFVERGVPPSLTAVTTSVDIDADAKVVWKNVVAFSQLRPPTEFIFKTGIAYPVNATINGTGVGAIRYCNFSTGSFVEPITVWDENRLLGFDVADQPQPMKELSFWDIDAPHLHDYFVSKKGQFKLVRLPDGRTRLEGTTWYYHNIKPAVYWRPWSNYIIHSIHRRVLKHIQELSEQDAGTGLSHPQL